MDIGKYRKIFGVGPAGVAISLVVLALLLLLSRGLGGAEISNQPMLVRIAGLILMGTWVCWHFWSITYIKSWWRSDKLCTTGPYGFVRHPMYAGGLFLAGPGLALILNSWVVLLLTAIMYPVWSRLVRNEEKLMTAVFGDDYRSYAARTRRFFPRLLK
jgi:protein-S-isoprenylcysteine O-methyltransferase Ste14